MNTQYKLANPNIIWIRTFETLIFIWRTLFAKTALTTLKREGSGRVGYSIMMNKPADVMMTTQGLARRWKRYISWAETLLCYHSPAVSSQWYQRSMGVSANTSISLAAWEQSGRYILNVAESSRSSHKSSTFTRRLNTQSRWLQTEFSFVGCDAIFPQFLSVAAFSCYPHVYILVPSRHVWPTFCCTARFVSWPHVQRYWHGPALYSTHVLSL